MIKYYHFKRWNHLFSINQNLKISRSVNICKYIIMLVKIYIKCISWLIYITKVHLRERNVLACNLLVSVQPTILHNFVVQSPTWVEAPTWLLWPYYEQTRTPATLQCNSNTTASIFCTLSRCPALSGGIPVLEMPEQWHFRRG